MFHIERAFFFEICLYLIRVQFKYELLIINFYLNIGGDVAVVDVDVDVISVVCGRRLEMIGWAL